MLTPRSPDSAMKTLGCRRSRQPILANVRNPDRRTADIPGHRQRWPHSFRSMALPDMNRTLETPHNGGVCLAVQWRVLSRFDLLASFITDTSQSKAHQSEGGGFWYFNPNSEREVLLGAG